MTDVYVVKETKTEDGMGGVSTTTSSTLLSKAIIYQEGSNNRFSGWNASLSDKITRESTHILVCKPSAYTWASTDKRVIQGSYIFDIIGNAYNIMDKNEVQMIGLRQRV